MGLSRLPGVGRLLAIYVRRHPARFHGRWVKIRLRNGVTIEGRVSGSGRRALYVEPSRPPGVSPFRHD